MRILPIFTSRIVPSFSAGLLLLLASTGLQASSILAVDLEQMLAQSALVFEGRVIRHEVKSGNSPRNVHTLVVFEVLDVIKGSVLGQSLSLSFTGGTINGRTLRVTDLDLPKVGEKGIYFVENPSRRQINPLYGWSQGHFRLHKDAAGIERVTTARKAAVTAIQWQEKSAAKKSSPDGLISKGAARGVVYSQQASLNKAITVSDFKAQLKDRLLKLPK